MKTIQQSVEQLERSERGQKTVKLLRDFLKSGPVKGLDDPNCEAVTLLVTHYMLGSGTDSCNVIDAMDALIERHGWVLQ